MQRAGLPRTDLLGAIDPDNRFVVSPGLEMEKRTRVGRFEMAGIELEELLEAQDRLVETFLLLQELTETAPAVDRIRREHEAAIKALDRLVEATLLLERAREVEEIIRRVRVLADRAGEPFDGKRSEEHTSELQSPCNLVCRLLLEKKNKE